MEQNGFLSRIHAETAHTSIYATAYYATAYV